MEEAIKLYKQLDIPRNTIEFLVTNKNLNKNNKRKLVVAINMLEGSVIAYLMHKIQESGTCSISDIEHFCNVYKEEGLIGNNTKGAILSTSVGLIKKAKDISQTITSSNNI